MWDVAQNSVNFWANVFLGSVNGVEFSYDLSDY